VAFCAVAFYPVAFCPWHFLRGILSYDILSGGILPRGIFSRGILSWLWHFVRWHFIPWHFVQWHFVPDSLQRYLPDRPDPRHSLSERSHNKSLITKSSELSERVFLIRALYKDCDWHFNFRILFFIYYSMLGCVWQLLINVNVNVNLWIDYIVWGSAFRTTTCWGCRLV